MNKIYQNGKMKKLNLWLYFQKSIALVVSQLLVAP